MSYGLRPRPPVDAVVAALVAEAALEIWPRAPAASATEVALLAREGEAERSWRLSGRWWTRRADPSRGRPWTR
ncbi:MAG: hypothetical protein ACRDXC_10570 [Acidimicrobiales bacterium]